MNRWRIAALALACLLPVGCTAAPVPTPTPTPAPTFRCTPEAGGADHECSQFDYEQMVAKDKLYAEAEAVYRKFFAEDVRIYRAGGVDEPTPILLETTTGRFLEDSMRIYRALRKYETRAVGGEFRISWLHRIPGESKNGSEVTLQSCTDASSVLLVAPGAKDLNAGWGLESLYFSRIEGSIKLSSASGDQVASC
jgi:hypothetical protein